MRTIERRRGAAVPGGGLAEPGRSFAVPGGALAEPGSAGAAPPLALVVKDGGRVVGGCTLWLQGKRGCIGRLHAIDANSADAVLLRAGELLEEMGCRYAVGPMDGSTWQQYRVVTFDDGSERFFGEPSTASLFAGAFERCGFPVVGRYSSAAVSPAEALDLAADTLEGRFASSGVRLRCLRADNLEDELRALYEVSIRAFSNNSFYSDSDWAQFYYLYGGLAGQLDPSLVLIAEEEDGALVRPVGFLLAFPAGAAPSAPGEAVGGGRTVVLKTIGRLPEERYRGLGRLLTHRVMERALALGYSRAVFALYKDDNVSSRFPARSGARVIRRYELFGRALDGAGSGSLSGDR